ncbi:MAG: hypothetical protein KC776_40605, partial [Myxococcales bacterium]|nr:hypothetical protein [Myxococcales bacterium]
GNVGNTGGAPTCKSVGEGCAEFGECCSGKCAQGVCTGCSAAGDPCVGPADCCVDLVCNAGTCAACSLDGAGCTLATDCCSGICKQGTCVPCADPGSACTTASECCNGVGCQGSVCGATSGACTNPQDEGARSSHDLPKAVFDCANQCGVYPPPAGCIPTCMSSNYGLGAACAGCYESNLTCMVDNCASCGLDPTSAECMACFATHCGASFLACSGWPTP